MLLNMVLAFVWLQCIWVPSRILVQQAYTLTNRIQHRDTSNSRLYIIFYKMRIHETSMLDEHQCFWRTSFPHILHLRWKQYIPLKTWYIKYIPIHTMSHSSRPSSTHRCDDFIYIISYHHIISYQIHNENSVNVQTRFVNQLHSSKLIRVNRLMQWWVSNRSYSEVFIIRFFNYMNFSSRIRSEKYA